MKTYVLTLSQKFPKTHKKAGEETNFVNKIFDGSKIHTIRSNYELWEKRINEVKEGKAILSLRFWSGKPYNSKQVEFSKLSNDNNIDIQKIENAVYSQNNTPESWKIGDNYFNNSEICENDGLSENDFIEWFRKYDLSKPMAIIHFTSKRY